MLFPLFQFRRCLCVQKFRLELVDGAALARLSEDHLVRYIGMKLGPAVSLRAALQRLDPIGRE